MAFTGCGSEKPLPDAPYALDYTLTPSNEGKDNTQKITLRLRYSKPVTVLSSAADAFDVQIAGSTLDKETMGFHAASDPQDPTLVVMEIYALPSASTPSEGSKYFAVREAGLILTLKKSKPIPIRDEKNLPVRWTDISCIIPSGLTLTPVSSTTGNALTGTRARYVTKVTDTSKIRANIWLQLRRNGEPVIEENFQTQNYRYANRGSFPLHAHQFLMLEAKDYAKLAAEELQSLFGKNKPYLEQFNFSFDGDQIIIEATKAIDDDTLELVVYEYPLDQDK